MATFTIPPLLFALAPSAWGLTLGSISVKSHLGEPFDATVPISLADKETNLPVEATKALPQDYKLLGLEYPQQVSALLLNLGGKGGSRALRIQSKLPVNVPFFNFLLKITTSQGDQFRNYPIFLEVRPSALSHDFHPAPPVVSAVREQGTSAIDKGEYGPIRPGETLSRVAEKIPLPPYNRNQIAIALYEFNRDQFVDGDMNHLRTGSLLKIPPRAKIASLLATHHQNANAEAAKAPSPTQGKESVAYSPPATTAPDPAGAATAKSPINEAPLVMIVRTRLSSTDNKDGSIPLAPVSAHSSMASPLGQSGGVTAPSASSQQGPCSAAAGANPGEVETLKHQIASLTKQLTTAEVVRARLLGQVHVLERRLKKKESKPHQLPPTPPAPANIFNDIPWDLIGLGGGGLVFLGGLFGYLRRKKARSGDKTRGGQNKWQVRFHSSRPSIPEKNTTPTPTSMAPAKVETDHKVKTPSPSSAPIPQEDIRLAKGPLAPVAAVPAAALADRNPLDPVTEIGNPPSEVHEKTDAATSDDPGSVTEIKPEAFALDDSDSVTEIKSEALTRDDSRSVAEIIATTTTVLPPGAKGAADISLADKKKNDPFPTLLDLGNEADEGDSIFNLTQPSEPAPREWTPNFGDDGHATMIDLGQEEEQYQASIFNLEQQAVTTPSALGLEEGKSEQNHFSATFPETLTAPTDTDPLTDPRPNDTDSDRTSNHSERLFTTDDRPPEPTDGPTTASKTRIDDGISALETLEFSVPVATEPEATPSPPMVSPELETIDFDSNAISGRMTVDGGKIPVIPDDKQPPATKNSPRMSAEDEPPVLELHIDQQP
ncbi:MAG: hypothetical protein HQL73_04100 [Magnetococcales bacterium]|nr:hypothetical protein [Magnetococcales bacterium]